MRLSWIAAVTTAAAASIVLTAFTGNAQAAGGFIGTFSTETNLTSTVPANGDVNPYGVAVVPASSGALHKGDVLISNFNSSANLQGTGTTIVKVAPDNTQTVFAQLDPAHLPGACPGGIGLTTALSVLRSGWVIVGSLPTTDGTAATAQSGCLLVLDSHGVVRETFSGHGINGPWDMTALDLGGIAELFVTNVLNGTVAANGSTVNRGTVLRLTLVIVPGGPPKLVATMRIGSGFPERTDPAALVIGPTGVGLGPNGTLYVADTLGNRVTAIPNAIFRLHSAGTGTTVTSAGSLNAPLGLAIAPGGDILTVNSGDGNIVDTTPGGSQVATKTITPAGGGALFGLAIQPGHPAVYFVDDSNNTLNLFH
jgi:hypothetical protein